MFLTFSKYACAILIFTHTTGSACTDFILKARDGNCVVGRSMEFGQILPTAVKLFPKGEQVQSAGYNRTPGMRWSSKYTYLAMVNTAAHAVMDGFNEKGLSLGLLWFPGTQYPNTPNAAPNTVINLVDLPNWILGNFASVDEVVAALPKINVYPGEVQGFAGTPPIHISLHDASGKSAVVEFVNGKMNLYNNIVGVLTNAPDFPWHVTNLRNYINLSALNRGTLNIDGSVLQPTGQGTGLLGIPGDWTPPSRFVRAALFKQLIQQPNNAQSAVLAAIHLLNTVDIPFGAIRESQTEGFDFTQWIVVKDLTKKILYVRTYGNQNIQEIDLLSDSSTHGTAQSLDLNIELPQ